MALQLFGLLRQLLGFLTHDGEAELPSTQKELELTWFLLCTQGIFFPQEVLRWHQSLRCSSLCICLSSSPMSALSAILLQCPHEAGESLRKVPKDMSSCENLLPGCRNLYVIYLCSRDQETRGRDHKVKSIFSSGH